MLKISEFDGKMIYHIVLDMLNPILRVPELENRDSELKFNIFISSKAIPKAPTLCPGIN